MLASVKQTEAASHCLQMSAFTETLLGSVLLCPLLGVSYTTFFPSGCSAFLILLSPFLQHATQVLPSLRTDRSQLQDFKLQNVNVTPLAQPLAIQQWKQQLCSEHSPFPGTQIS